jgi:hypothetical protein
MRRVSKCKTTKIKIKDLHKRRRRQVQRVVSTKGGDMHRQCSETRVSKRQDNKKN